MTAVSTLAQANWSETSVALLVVAILGAIAIVVVWQIFATARARVSVAREEAYRQLAEEHVRHQRQVTEELERATTDLADLRARTTEIERLLKEVG